MIFCACCFLRPKISETPGRRHATRHKKQQASKNHAFGRSGMLQCTSSKSPFGTYVDVSTSYPRLFYLPLRWKTDLQHKKHVHFRGNARVGFAASLSKELLSSYVGSSFLLPRTDVAKTTTNRVDSTAGCILTSWSGLSFPSSDFAHQIPTHHPNMAHYRELQKNGYRVSKEFLS